jgi:hypothetical protein
MIYHKKNINLSIFLLYFVLLFTLSGCIPKNLQQSQETKFTPLAQKIGIDKVALCSASATYYNEKGKKINYNFGTQYSNIYFTDKWLSAKAAQEFYFRLSQNFPKDLMNSKYNELKKVSNFSRENVQECVNNLNEAPSEIKQEVFREAPFIVESQVLNFLCSSDTNVNGHRMIGGDDSGVNAVYYHELGANPGNYIICSNEQSLPINVRDIEILNALLPEVAYVAKVKNGDEFLYSALKYKSNPIVENYFPDEAQSNSHTQANPQKSTHLKKKKK